MAQVAIAVAIGAVTAVGSYLLLSNQSQKNKVEGPRLGSSNLTTSTEGEGITRLFGRQRLNGQIIWATQFKETVNTTTTTTESGGKGGGGGSSTTETTEYTYSISLAIAFCEGNSKTTLSRMWADGKEIDISLLNLRYYPGSQTQNVDPKIEEVQGIGNAPAYRGIAYVVIEDMQLAEYGNRVPQITVEIVAPIETDDPVDIQTSGKAFCLAPTVGETIYSPSQVDVRTGGSPNNYTTRPDNVHNAYREPDVVRSVADLKRTQDDLDAVLIAVSWFGDDLRAGNCTVRPKQEDANRILSPDWTVGTYNRSNSPEVPKDDEGRPVHGGTPSDQSITELIQYLNGLGKRVIFYPFILVGSDSSEIQAPQFNLPINNPDASNGTNGWTNAIGGLGANSIRPELNRGGSNAYFTGGISSVTEAYQDSSVPLANIMAVDANSVTAHLSYMQASFSDPATVNMEFYDQNMVQIGVRVGLPVQVVSPALTWVSQTYSHLIPIGTRFIRTIYRSERRQGTNNLGYIDDIAITMTTSSRPNPYSDNASQPGQPAFPWRGRITCSPADGFAGSPNNTPVAGAQINTFFDEYDAMIEHYADLCAAAGGVDAFIVGAGLPGLTKVRSAPGVYPAVSRLRTLAAYAKTALSASKIGYAADWSEWVDDAPDGLWFHLDPLWSDNNIDFCGVDNYLPMSDWRDGTQHLDYDGINGPLSEFDPEYLAGQIEGGEYFDYFYASQTDRDNQVRTPIIDGYYGKPWVYRRKDFRSWWSNHHYDRPDGIEVGSPTGWVPHSKPIWFTQFGVPAVNKGTNQPNVFYDPKSSESALPYYSSGSRDDFIQRVAVETMLDYWRNNSPSSGGLTMIEPQNMFVWAWDARPFPDYPVRSDVWLDSDLWSLGHWFTGRIESVPLPRLVAALCRSAGLTDDQFDTDGLYGCGALVRGFQIDRPETIRASLETLMQAYLFDGFESEGKIKFLLRSNTKTSYVSDDDFVVSDNAPVGITLTRGQETDLPTLVKITFVDEANSYNSATIDGKTSRGNSQNIEEIDVPITLDPNYARSLADGIIQQRWIERQGGSMSLPPSLLRLDPGDAITVPVGENKLTVRLTVLALGQQRDSEFTAFNPDVFNLPPSSDATTLPAFGSGLLNLPLSSSSSTFGSATVLFMDLPIIRGNIGVPYAPRVVACADPWPGSVDVYRLLPDETYQFNVRHGFRNPIGQLNTPLASGPIGVWDRGNVLDVTFDYGALVSVSEATALESAIALGVYNEVADEWEVIQFATALLTGKRTYNVTDLLRGQLGTEHAMPVSYPAGTRVVLLEPAFLSTVATTDDLSGVEQTYSWGPSRYPHTDETYQSGTFIGKRVGLRPYAPTGVKLATNTVNDLIIDWKRRTRFNGDNWTTAAEPPLNEETEQYRVRVYDGSNVVHEAVTTSPTYTYTAAQQTTDFGSTQSTLKVDVAQFGAAFGGYGITNLDTHAIRSART